MRLADDRRALAVVETPEYSTLYVFPPDETIRRDGLNIAEWVERLSGCIHAVAVYDAPNAASCCCASAFSESLVLISSTYLKSAIAAVRSPVWTDALPRPRYSELLLGSNWIALL